MRTKARRSRARRNRIVEIARLAIRLGRRRLIADSDYHGLSAADRALVDRMTRADTRIVAFITDAHRRRLGR